MLFAKLEPGAFAIGPILAQSRARRSVSGEGRFIETIRTRLVRELLRPPGLSLFALPSSKPQDDSKLLLGTGFGGWRKPMTPSPSLPRTNYVIVLVMGPSSLRMELTSSCAMHAVQ